ncbi:MAG: transcriptional regulator [Chitinophagaceae bacterium]|nr:transcriptional regulator [Chitinophagaceae bacterium]
MNNTPLRSHCPITTGIDVIGDKWTLLIIRHMLFRQQYTYGQLLEIKEKIASKVLADRLRTLVADGLIEKRNHPTNKKVFLYTLTDKGISTIEIMTKIINFSVTHYRGQMLTKPIDKTKLSYMYMHAKSEAIFIKDTKAAYIKFRKNLLDF